MPYRSWQMSPSGPDSTLLTISRAHLEVKVEIKVGTAALLLSPPPTPPYCHTHLQGGDTCHVPLLNKMADHWMSTMDLMKVCTCIRTQCWPQRMSALVTCAAAVYFHLDVFVLLYLVRIYLYVCVYMCVCVCVCVFLYVQMCMCVCLCICLDVRCMCICG